MGILLKNILKQPVLIVNVPSGWKVDSIVLILKSGDCFSGLTHDSISLTIVPCKLLGHVLYFNVMLYLEENDIVHSEQHKVVYKSPSSETQLLKMIHDLCTNLDKGTEADAIISH